MNRTYKDGCFSILMLFAVILILIIVVSSGLIKAYNINRSCDGKIMSDDLTEDGYLRCCRLIGHRVNESDCDVYKTNNMGNRVWE